MTMLMAAIFASWASGVFVFLVTLSGTFCVKRVKETRVPVNVR